MRRMAFCAGCTLITAVVLFQRGDYALAALMAGATAVAVFLSIREEKTP